MICMASVTTWGRYRAGTVSDKRFLYLDRLSARAGLVNGHCEGWVLAAKTGSHMLTAPDTAYVKSSKGWMFCEDSKIAKAQEKDVVVSFQRPNNPNPQSTIHNPNTVYPYSRAIVSRPGLTCTTLNAGTASLPDLTSTRTAR
jgi:hypothetical protein